MVQDIGIQLGQYCWKRLHKEEHEISMKDFGYTWVMKAVTRKTRILQGKQWISLLFTIYSGTLCGIPISQEMLNYTYSIQLEGEHLSHRNFLEFSIHFGKWNNFGRKKEYDRARQAVFFAPLNPFGNDPRWRETSWWSHCSSKSSLPNLLETQSRCGFLDKIIQSAGTRIAILANKIICNHHRRQSARRLHWSCDFSERRSTNIREARNSKASTQGHVEE